MVVSLVDMPHFVIAFIESVSIWVVSSFLVIAINVVFIFVDIFPSCFFCFAIYSNTGSWNVRKVTLSTDKNKYGIRLRAEPDHMVLGASERAFQDEQ